jgi:hypothetical protein
MDKAPIIADSRSLHIRAFGCLSNSIASHLDRVGSFPYCPYIDGEISLSRYDSTK